MRTARLLLTDEQADQLRHLRPDGPLFFVCGRASYQDGDRLALHVIEAGSIDTVNKACGVVTGRLRAGKIPVERSSGTTQATACWNTVEMNKSPFKDRWSSMHILRWAEEYLDAARQAGGGVIPEGCVELCGSRPFYSPIFQSIELAQNERIQGVAV